MLKKNSIVVILLFSLNFLFANNFFEKDKFNTVNSLSFYVDHIFNENAKFYTRLTAGMRYQKNFISSETGLSDFTFIPSIDLVYFEFKTSSGNKKNDDKMSKFDIANALFSIRFGRIPVMVGNNLLLDMKGEGLDLNLSVKQFSMRVYGVTNSFDYLRFFDFIGDVNPVIFTAWDKKRIPPLTNFNIPGNNNGFISDIDSSDFNFYFTRSTGDYTDAEMKRLNDIRLLGVVSGRVFSGVTFAVNEVYNQNFSLDFIANIDLIPEEFIVTYPSQINQIKNTFGGRYNSFYISLNANGKIIKGLYYDVQGVYQTGTNATYYDNGVSIKTYDALINSFALYHSVSYLFDHITRPSVSFSFYYAHGDSDVEYVNNTVVNKSGDDNSFKSPAWPTLGYVIQPVFTNLFVFSLSHTIKPFRPLNIDFLNEFGIQLTGLLFFRPVIEGESFLPEKANFIKGQPGFTSSEKYFLGGEIDISLIWRLFSDLLIRVNTGFFIPNYNIYYGNEFIFKAGLSAVILF